MAYKALYRSYRPQTFEDVAGQEHIIKTLQNAIKEQRISHAYLFAGPRGTGKTTIAKIFAKAINCEAQHVPCNQCENCKEITEGTHPDIFEIDAASNNGVDEVRDLIEKVKYAPIKAKYKVYIIDEVHMMSTSAFNALLKTLEEPPAHIVFILATTEPHKLLPTIISRCQRFDFQRIENKDIVSRLEYVLKKENRNYEKEAVIAVSKLAEGGMRDALSILEQCLAYDPNLTLDNVNQVYGLLSMDKKISLIKNLLSKNIKQVLIDLDQMLSSSVNIKSLTFDLIDVLKDVVIYKNTKDANTMFVCTQDDINSLAPYITVEECFHMIDIFIDASNHYNQAINSNMYFEVALLKICNKVKEENKIVVQSETVTKPVLEMRDVQKEVKFEKIETIEDIPVMNKEVQTEVKTETKEETKEEVKSEEQSNDLTKPHGDVIVSEDDIMNILVQARRTILEDAKEKWSVLEKYQFNLNTRKIANLLCDSSPVAACKGGIIISFKFQPFVNKANYSINYNHIKSLISEVLGDEFDYIAVNENEWPNIRQKFIQLKRANQLPAAKPITLSHIKEINEDDLLNDAQKYAKDMFGDIVVFEE